MEEDELPQELLVCTVGVVGYHNILFSVDYPFESNMEAVRWFGSLPIADSDRRKLAHLNAGRVLKLSQPLKESIP